MDLKHALSIHRIDLQAQVSTKKRALELVSESCATAREKPDFFHALIEREKLGSTGLGHGVALPHARLAQLHSPMACLFKLTKPIEYEASDGQPVDLIIGLFVPEESHEAHLHLLAQIAQLLSQESVRAALRACKSAQAALSLMTEPLGDKTLVS
jgi:PTS system nitrogen regulatory IIA component